MPFTTPSGGANRLVEALPRKEKSSFLARSRTVVLVPGELLCEPGRDFQHVYFPLGGFISLRSQVDGNRTLEVRLVGNEGMLGATLALGIRAAPLRGLVQRAGPALRMNAGPFRKKLRDSPALLRILHSYLYSALDEISHGAACIHYHDVQKRLARCLLMSHDRAQADEFHLTHQHLADMLGVRRSAVTIAAGALRRKGLIRYSRGEIFILDRPALETASCTCYEATGRHFH